MKKFLILFLTVATIASAMIPAAAITAPTSLDGSNVPVIAIYGDGEAIYDENNNMIFKFSEMLNSLTSSDEDGENNENGESEDNAVLNAVIEILQPFLLEGILYDQWDNYYTALEKEIGDLFTKVRYNNNGECDNNTDISKELRKIMENTSNTDFKKVHGSYRAYDYQFWYDWRQDPRKSADELHKHIENIKTATGCEKVSLLTHCLGTTVAFSYISKYGTDSLHGISIDGSVIEGAEIISESISGKFTIDGDAINRMLLDLNATGSASIDEFITSSIDLATKSGLIDGITSTLKATIYGKIVKGVTSALSLSTFFTWPGYWACVAEEDYSAALEYVFGDEGSDKRVQYAGLIEKIEGYHNDVRAQLDELYDELEEAETKICVIGKYGFQLAPIVESDDQIADQFATLTRASLGATTAPSIFEPFSQEYIEQKSAAGKDKYISPDRMVDASTCRFPDYTWFTKNISHSYWHDFEEMLAYSVITSDVQYTVDDFDFTQFVVHDYETGEVSAMTEDNCHTESWYEQVKDGPQNGLFSKLTAYFKSLITWFKLLFEMLFG